MVEKTSRILFIAHAPSPNTVRLRDSAVARINDARDSDTFIDDEISIELQTLSPFDTTLDHIMAADGLIIGTTENIGAMAGATKDFFDRTYNDLLDVKAGLPVAVYIRAGLDGTGTKRGIESIMTGLKWRLIAPPLILKGPWQDHFPDDTAELALTLAAGVALNIY